MATILKSLYYWSIVYFIWIRTSIRLVDCFNHFLVFCFQFLEILFNAINLFINELSILIILFSQVFTLLTCWTASNSILPPVMT